MRKPGSLRIDNFRLAQRRDGALRQDKLYSMRTLQNFDVIYTDGRLRVRPGYTRWNTTALPAVATQLFYFVPLDNPSNAHLLGISNSRWYGISEAGAHNLLSTEPATARRPVLTVGERCFFGTDTGWRWTDDSSIGGATKSYRVGIRRSTQPPSVSERVVDGHSDHDVLTILNTTTQRRIAIPFQLAHRTAFSRVNLHVLRQGVFAATDQGNVRIGIYEDSGGPSNTLADGLAATTSSALSDWMNVLRLPHGLLAAAAYREFELRGPLTLEGSTTYWIVLEGDDEYYDIMTLPFGPYCGVTSETAPAVYAHGKLQTYDLPGTAWNEADFEARFYIGGLVQDAIYDYVITYYNESYIIESRPSDYMRLEVTGGTPAIQLTGRLTTDGQVDKVRLYRRELDVDAVPPQDLDTSEEEILDVYRLVGEATPGDAFIDALVADDLGAVLQTQDHYTWDDVNEAGEDLRDAAILPAITVLWKDRVWLATGTDNKLWFTKTLEQDGATGLTNDPIYDYIPLENVREIPCPSRIIALAVLPQDQLAVFFENESVWIVWGANESLNPPADIAFRELMPKGGLIAPAGLDESKRGLYFLSRDGMYVLPGLEYMTETNQSILDDVENTYIDDSRVLVFGNEVWLLIDSDNDGTLDTTLILDMQRDIPTRQLYDSAWKMYSYNVGLNDIVVKQKGGSARTILAADAVNFYILELGDGVNDNGSAIVAEVESHDLRARNMAMIHEVDIDAVYSGNPPAYTLTLTDHNGGTQAYTRTPSSSDDIRLHKIGCRFNQPVSMRAKLSMSALAAHELLSMEILYIRD